MKTRGIVSLTVTALTMGLLFAGLDSAFAQEKIYLDRGLFLKNPTRTMGTIDPIMEQIIAGKAITPAAGEKVTFAGDKSSAWTEDTADGDHWFKGADLRGGYALFEIKSPVEKKAILESCGNEVVYVNSRHAAQGNEHAPFRVCARSPQSRT
jgi:hypothetical protein